MSHDHSSDPFNALRDTDAPAPSAEARARALATAQAAFAAEPEKSTAPTQGLGLGARLMSIIASFRRISIMDMRIPVGTAAIALLVLPIGWQLYSSTALLPGATVSRPAPVAAPTTTMPTKEAADAAAQSTTASSTALPDSTVKGDSLREVAPLQPTPAPIASEPMAELAAAPPPPVSDTALSRMPAPVAPAPMSMLAQDARSSGGSSYMTPSQATEVSGDTFTSFDEQRLRIAAEEPVSTFSLDVDTASYAYVRRQLEDGYVPEADAVRIEELINYFPYDYPAAPSAEVPFQPTVKVFPTPWNSKTQILQVGIKGYMPAIADTKSNLVFLIDTSGSMDEPDKLPLLKRAFGLLLDQLSANDTVSIVTYAGSAGVALEPTSADKKAKIMAALDQLSAGGSTAGAEGIELAYRLAEEAKVEGGTNRVILATDGDFNVGIDDPQRLEKFIAGKRKSGVSLSVLGFGQGNLDDATMQAMAQNGNGNASYISSFAEARKVLVEEIGGTLHTIAKDVKVQVEFNPAVVAEYRLIGYETRVLNREDFNNDALDAGDVGAGTTVTALYEITPKGSGAEQVEPLRYGTETAGQGGDEIAFLKMRYKLPDSDVSQLIETPVTPKVVYTDIAAAGIDAQFATAVAAFGQKLKDSVYAGDISWAEIKALAQAGRGADEGGYRTEFARLVDDAAALKPDGATKPSTR